MTEFAKQLQEMAEATIKAAIRPFTEDDVIFTKEVILLREEFQDVKSYFNNFDNIVYISLEKNPEAFEIVIEKLKEKAPVKTFNSENISMTVYSDSNVGYVVVISEIETNKPYTIFWNA